MPAKKPCIKCNTPNWPMHMKAGVCRDCQKADGKTLAQALYAIQVRTEMLCQQERNEYGGKVLSEKTIERIQTIPACKSVEEAEKLSQEAVRWSQVHFLSEWAKGRIRGKVTAERLEKEAKEADNLATFLAKKGLADQAQQQRERAATLRSELQSMRKKA